MNTSLVCCEFFYVCAPCQWVLQAQSVITDRIGNNENAFEQENMRILSVFFSCSVVFDDHT